MRSTPLGEEKDANLARDEETGEVRKIRGERYIYIQIEIFPINDLINIDVDIRCNKVFDTKRCIVPLLGAQNLGIQYRVTYLET